MMRRRWWWLLLALPLVAGLARLRFDAEILNLLPDLPSVRGLQEHQQHFPNAGELWVTVGSSNAPAAAEAAQAIAEQLRRHPELVRSARWQPPWQERPADAAENLAWLWLQQPPDELKRLAQRLAPENLSNVLAQVRETLATELDPQELVRTGYDPLGLTRVPGAAGPSAGMASGNGIFLNDAGTFRVILVEPAQPDMNYREASAWLADVRTQCQAALTSVHSGAPEPVRLGFTGRPAFLAEISVGMERDLKNSVLSTVLLIAGLFWLAHRTWKPLAWLIASLLLTLVLTLALAGLTFGTLNVVSVGFAAVLLGLAVDYGLVGYQEAVARPGASSAEVRREVSRGIWYSAITTSGTFLLLGFTGLPGLARLGQLTALGLLVGAMVMVYFFLPRVCPVTTGALPSPPQENPEPSSSRGSWGFTALILGGIILVFAVRGWPGMTTSDDPLRPRNSTAYVAMDEARDQLGRTKEPLRLLFRGPTVEAVARQLEAVAPTLAAAQARGEVTSFELPLGFWPRPEWAAPNQGPTRELAARQNELRTAVLDAGFTSNSLALAEGILQAWPRLTDPNAPVWPTNPTARWLTGQFAAQTAEGQYLALGAVWPGPNLDPTAADLRLPPDVLVSSWESLASRLASHVQRRVVGVTTLIALALVFFLWLAFRNWREVVLGLLALVLSLTLLLAVMSLAGWTWNLLSLVALPLLLGSSVDSTIHMQLALRRHRGDRAAVWRTTGKALRLCAAANIAGFGSLAWSSNLGLASLDLICATGVGCVFTVCVGLLPSWWRRFASDTKVIAPRPAAPSALYGVTLWRAGQRLGYGLPEGLAQTLASTGATLYRWFRPTRFAVVVANLQPIVGGDGSAAVRAARQNFRQFAAKLVDLWRYEAGVSFENRLHPAAGWNHFSTALNSGRGVLLVTPHLGNWEFGAPLLRRHGQRPLVLTAPEPGGQFTEIRAAARALQGIDTLVVGEDPFAFVEVIRRLQDGGVVALLVDRPPAATAVEVPFFGRPFQASIAVAELARATGAVVLPVFIVRDVHGYQAHALEPVAYDRRALGTRAARVALTAEILRAFEPVIRQFPDQWFHFVPVWDVTEQTPPAS